MYIQELEGELKEIGKLPKKYTFSNGNRTGNFDLLDSEALELEGFYPLEVWEVEFDAEKEIVEFHYKKEGNKYLKIYKKVPLSLEAVKENKISEIQNHFALLLSSFTVEYKGTEFIINQEVLNNITELQSLVSITNQFPQPFSWTDKYNNEVSFSQEEFNSFVELVGSQKLGYVIANKTLPNVISQLSTIDEVLNYKY